MKKYICVIGRSGAGKETAYRILQKQLFDFRTDIIHFSDPLNQTLADWQIPNVRANQQALSTFLRTAPWLNEFNLPMTPVWIQEMLSRVVEKRALESMADIVFLDGVRRPADLAMLRRLPNSLLIGIVRDSRFCFEGLRKRADRPGDAEKTWEQYCEEQKAETEQMIDQLIQKADILIQNNGTLDELEKKLRSVTELLHSPE